MAVKLGSLTPREECKLKVCEKRLLRRTFGKLQEAGEGCIMMSFKTQTLHQILFG
jgi:hypothetical protein